jgi:hypothetical protein
MLDLWGDAVGNRFFPLRCLIGCRLSTLVLAGRPFRADETAWKGPPASDIIDSPAMDYPAGWLRRHVDTSTGAANKRWNWLPNNVPVWS